MLLTLAAAVSLATACVPSIPHVRDRLVAHAMVESPGFDTLAIHDNTTKAVYHPSDETTAWALAASLLAAGHSVDGGLTQVNSQHWQKLKLTGLPLVRAKPNMCGGAVILIQDYAAACLYNSGKPNCDPRYPAAVDHAMKMIAQQSETAEVAAETNSDVQQARDPCADVPSWDLWAIQECREGHGKHEEDQGQ